MVWALLAASLLVILAGAELFTNGIEWIGEGFGLSEGAVGSVLAAVGTALPETLLPLVAILSGHASGEEIGVGAILGAPFMLTTLAMVVIAVTVLVTARGGDEAPISSSTCRCSARTSATSWSCTRSPWSRACWTTKRSTMRSSSSCWSGTRYYVRRHFQAPAGGELEKEAGTEIKRLHLWRAMRLVRPSLSAWSKDVSAPAPFVQVAFALALIIGGAELFIHAVDDVAELFNISPLAFSLLVAPIATELPEKFNSVIWIRRRKDTLALGNMTGAMVFQSSFPVTIGLLLTPWHLEGTALVAAVIALLAGGVLWLQVRFRGRLTAQLLLLQGIFYVGYVTYVITRL